MMRYLTPAIIIFLLTSLTTGLSFYLEHVYQTQEAAKRASIRQLIWIEKDRAAHENRDLTREERTRIEQWEDRLKELSE